MFAPLVDMTLRSSAPLPLILDLRHPCPRRRISHRFDGVLLTVLFARSFSKFDEPLFGLVCTVGMSILGSRRFIVDIILLS